MNAREVNRRIESLGGVAVSQRGSHRKYRASRTLPDNTVITAQTVVAQHRGDIAIGTLRAMERQMEPVFGKGWLL
ncbi:MAG: type II toxin-antitoxin system HicA family toxin [Candidatus Nanopelagicales bacterium]|nr:type II toxin-antitoxin system HicA family toxin [Candidatus Nanopelagicales bacterium]